jgi:hypothetical protein
MTRSCPSASTWVFASRRCFSLACLIPPRWLHMRKVSPPLFFTGSWRVQSYCNTHDNRTRTSRYYMHSVLFRWIRHTRNCTITVISSGHHCSTSVLTSEINLASRRTESRPSEATSTSLMWRASEGRVTFQEWKRTKLNYLSQRSEGRRHVTLCFFF